LETGKHVYYYNSGQIKNLGLYKFGNKEGDWITYNEDGLLTRTITYKQGVVVKIDGQKVDQPKQENGNKG
jgi:antitoxin component YwqK of YwqJK toxin-antitoxin module